MSEELPPLPGRLAPGSQLAGYRVEEEIGRGGMAVVYRAYDDHLDRRVALKVLAPNLARDEVFRARFIQESRIKPTNMLLEISFRASQPDHLYLSDFGLAKPSAVATGLTATGQFFGTVDYVAPEQIQGDPLDGRTDQYALACAAFEMLSGSPPFRRENGMAVISAQLSDPPPSLSARVPGLPAAADRVIAKALAKSPADRYDRCLDFAEALLAAAAGVTYLVLHKTHGSGSAAGSRAQAGSSASSAPASTAPAAAASSGTVPALPSPPPPGVLSATVLAYYAAINHHHYARAWRLGGRNTGETYHAYVSGFAGTAHDAVIIQSVSGDVVTGQVTAQQSNGTVKTYQGSYTVEGGVIIRFNVRQIS